MEREIVDVISLNRLSRGLCLEARILASSREFSVEFSLALLSSPGDDITESRRTFNSLRVARFLSTTSGHRVVGFLGITRGC
jgi:hypothetical protein